jgi:hypothetical protein
VFDAAVSWASKGDGSLFWRPRPRAKSPESPKDLLTAQKKVSSGGAVSKNEEYVYLYLILISLMEYSQR